MNVEYLSLISAIFIACILTLGQSESHNFLDVLLILKGKNSEKVLHCCAPIYCTTMYSLS